MTGTDEALAGELEAALGAPTWAEALGHVHNAIAALSPPASEADQTALLREAVEMLVATRHLFAQYRLPKHDRRIAAFKEALTRIDQALADTGREG